MPNARTRRTVRSFLLMMSMLRRQLGDQTAGIRAVYNTAREAGVVLDLGSYNRVLETLGAEDNRPDDSVESPLERLDFGVGVFKEMVAQGISPDAEAYTHVIYLCLDADNANGALRYFKQMRESGVEVDAGVGARGIGGLAWMAAHTGTCAGGLWFQIYQSFMDVLRPDPSIELGAALSNPSAGPRTFGPHLQVLPGSTMEGPMVVDTAADMQPTNFPKPSAPVVVLPAEGGEADLESIGDDNDEELSTYDDGLEASTEVIAQQLGVEAPLLQYLYDAIDTDVRVVGCGIEHVYGMAIHSLDVL